jgi:hypothetical protein
MVDNDKCSPERKRAPARLEPSSISPETWQHFESITLAVVHRIQPTTNSEYFHAAIIDYVQRLIRFHTGCQVSFHALHYFDAAVSLCIDNLTEMP